MSKIDDTLSDKLNIEKIPTIEPELIVVKKDSREEDKTKSDIVNDFNTTRANLHNLLVKGEEALVHSLEIAKQSEHPRAFEVVGNMIKQLADVNQQLLDLHKQTASVSSIEKKNTVTNNNVFVGSTNELNKIIKNYKETEGE